MSTSRSGRSRGREREPSRERTNKRRSKSRSRSRDRSRRKGGRSRSRSKSHKSRSKSKKKHKKKKKDTRKEDVGKADTKCTGHREDEAGASSVPAVASQVEGATPSAPRAVPLGDVPPNAGQDSVRPQASGAAAAEASSRSSPSVPCSPDRSACHKEEDRFGVTPSPKKGAPRSPWTSGQSSEDDSRTGPFRTSPPTPPFPEYSSTLQGSRPKTLFEDLHSAKDLSNVQGNHEPTASASKSQEPPVYPIFAKQPGKSSSRFVLAMLNAFSVICLGLE